MPPAATACSSRPYRRWRTSSRYYYKGGSTFETDVWRTAAERAKARLGRRPQMAEYFSRLKELKDRGLMHAAPPYVFSPHTWQIVLDQLDGSLEAAIANW